MVNAVYGASGHTGRFVVAELLARGHAVIAIGRSRENLAACAFSRDVELRIASIDDAASLDGALAGAAAVIHCAGPFLDTAQAVVEAALRAGIHYFDVTAEQTSALSTFERFDAAARERGVVIAPAAGFYGGLGDILATAAMKEWTQADRIDLAIALDSWWPTLGTRRTGERNTFARLVVAGGKLERLQPSAPVSWNFPDPFGMQDVVELPFTETILIHRHLRVSAVHNYLNQTPLRDIRDPATPQPVAVDTRGRSKQQFLIEVVARNGNQKHRLAASGQDIYAVTAPLVAEAAERVCNGASLRAGAFALGEMFEASAFLQALSPEHLTLHL